MLKTAELSGAELDYWVAKAEGFNPVINDEECWLYTRDNDTRTSTVHTSPTASWTRKNIIATRYQPSQDWFDGGPVLQSRIMSLCLEEVVERTPMWSAYVDGNPYLISGRTPLEAAMRAYAFSKFGEEVHECRTQW